MKWSKDDLSMKNGEVGISSDPELIEDYYECLKETGSKFYPPIDKELEDVLKAIQDEYNARFSRLPAGIRDSLVDQITALKKEGDKNNLGE